MWNTRSYDLEGHLEGIVHLVLYGVLNQRGWMYEFEL